MIEKISYLVIDYGVRDLCQAPYPNHWKGCPNYGKRMSCPPKAPLIENFINLDNDIYLIFNIFPFGEHVERMREKHPEWSERQLANCLYWQQTARKQLRVELERFHKNSPGVFRSTMCPEAMGVNVTATMLSIGHELEWPPKTVTYQVAVAGLIT